MRLDRVARETAKIWRLIQFIIRSCAESARDLPGADGDFSPWTIDWIHFLEEAKALFFSSRFDKPTTVSPSAQSRIEERLDLFEEIFFTLNESTSMDHMHYANLCFAHFLGSFLFIDVYRNNFRPKEYSENVMNRVVHFMNDNIENNLKLADFANFCGYSESYFYRKFVKETGHSPMDYFTRMKINKACKLLIQTDMKVNQIAHKLGFKESQYFSRTFSNVMGLSPLEFRRQNFRL
ncbi:MAG: helix-turn-helix transcriptional regulator [Parabacteroides sp.]